MTLTDTHKAIMAAIGLLALGATGVTVFQTQKAAAADKEEVKKAAEKSVNELRAEFYLAEIAKINAKKQVTEDDKVLKERYMAMIKAIETERVEQKKAEK